MTLNEKEVLKKALTKAAGMGLGIDDTIGLIEMYQEVMSDIAAPGLVGVSLNSGLSIVPPPPVVIDPQARMAAPEKSSPPPVILSATSSINGDTHVVDRTLDECYQELKAAAPPYIEVLGPGRTVPARFMVEVFKREGQGGIPPIFGVALTAAGDPSKVEGKFSYSLGRPYDLESDIKEFKDTIYSMYKNAGKKITPNLPTVQMPSGGLGEQWG